MSDRVLTYECHVGDAAHDVPGPDVRILKTGDGGFIVACGCGPESVDDAEESPHPITDHLVNIYAEDPSPAQWLTLEGAADGWYDTTAWDSPEGFEGVNGQRRARFREQIREIADTNDRNERGGATERDRVARGWRVRIAAPALERSASGRRGIPFGNRTPSASRRPLKPELLQTTPGFERRGVDRAGRYRRVGVVPTLSLPGTGRRQSTCSPGSAGRRSDSPPVGSTCGRRGRPIRSLRTPTA